MITFLGLSPALDVTYVVDTVQLGGIHRPHRVLALPGGKALNAARAAVVLGADVHAIAPLGGFTGERVRAALTDAGIDAVFIATGTETRACVSVFDEGNAAPTEFYERAEELSPEAWRELLAAIDATESGWLALSGSLPVDERLGQLVDALANAQNRGIRLAIDTHGPALAQLLAQGAPELVKINRHEAAELLGSSPERHTAAQLADALAATLPSNAIAVVTDGADGAVAAFAHHRWHAAAPSAGRFAVGSGDCFLAGLLTSLDAHPGDLPLALATATAVAAANTLQPGAAAFDVSSLPSMIAASAVTALADSLPELRGA